MLCAEMRGSTCPFRSVPQFRDAILPKFWEKSDRIGKHHRFPPCQCDRVPTIVATGTIETSRLLLGSLSVCSSGVGNCLDQVGRHFHDHVSAPVATISGAARNELLSWMGPFFSGGTTHTGRLEAR